MTDQTEARLTKLEGWRESDKAMNAVQLKHVDDQFKTFGQTLKDFKTANDLALENFKKSHDKDLAGISKTLDGQLWWFKLFVGAFVSSLVGSFAVFVIKGGLNVP